MFIFIPNKSSDMGSRALLLVVCQAIEQANRTIGGIGDSESAGVGLFSYPHFYYAVVLH